MELTALAVALKPDLSPAHTNHGRALENDERLEDALMAYRRAIRRAQPAGPPVTWAARRRAEIHEQADRRARLGPRQRRAGPAS